MNNITEKHCVPTGNYNIRIQEYAATVLQSLPTRNAVKKAIKNSELYINGHIAKYHPFLLAVIVIYLQFNLLLICIIVVILWLMLQFLKR